VTNSWRALYAAFVITVALPGSAFAQGAKPASSTAKPTAPSSDRELNLKAYVELLRSDLRAEKVALITQVMGFTDAEDLAFWPIYRQYESDLARLNDERLRGIETYAKNYTTLSDSMATDLVTGALDLEARRVALKQKFFSQLKSALPARTAARAMQVENQILLLLDLQVASSLPVVQ
jgi:hypothetical protein